MDSFKEIENLISEDKIQKFDRFFYSKIKKRINELEASTVFPFKIKITHIFLSLAAGLIFGVFIGRIVQHQMWKDKRVLLMENVLNSYYLDEMKYECEDYQIVTKMCKKDHS